MKSPNANTHLSTCHLQHNIEDDQMILRESVSCHRLDYTQRPTTVIGDLPQKERRNPSFKNSFKKELKDKNSVKKRVNFDDTIQKPETPKPERENQSNQLLEPSNLKSSEEKSVSISSLSSLSAANETIDFIDEAEELTDRSKMKSEVKEVQDAKVDVKNESDSSNTSANCKDAALADVHIQNIIKLFDGSGSSENEKPMPLAKPKVFPRTHKSPPEVPLKTDKKPVVPPRVLRGKLDKSHSTPAYDLNNDTDNTEVIKMPLTATITPPEKVEESPTIKEPSAQVQNEEEVIKYELGIPVVETINAAVTSNFSEYITVGVSPEIKDVPPKPPPRTCTLDNYKPRYPAESPKPVIDNFKRPFVYEANKSSIYDSAIDAQRVASDTYQASNYLDTKSAEKSNTRPESIVKDYSEVHTYGIYDNYDNTKPKFEPKMVSTPISKHFKGEFSETDGLPRTPYNESKSENKVSPTNSVVRAMIYSSKNKAGKKKNSLVASKFDLISF